MRETPIIITGMLRSGTSYTAGWLNKLGLDLGDNLMPAGVGNIDGYFEDLDLVNFHEGILKDNNLSYKVKKEVSIVISDEKKNLAKEIISRKCKNHIWGWKVPMTCLILNFWDSIIPNAKYIFVYRDFRAVASSMYNWELSLYGKNTGFLKALFNLRFKVLKKYLFNVYISSWIIYNKKILEFINKSNSNRYIIINLSDIYNHPKALMNTISEKFEINLNTGALDESYSNFDISKISTASDSFIIDKKKEYEAKKILKELEKLRIKL